MTEFFAYIQNDREWEICSRYGQPTFWNITGFLQTGCGESAPASHEESLRDLGKCIATSIFLAIFVVLA